MKSPCGTAANAVTTGDWVAEAAMDCCARCVKDWMKRRAKSNGAALSLFGIAVVLIVLLFATDRRLGHYQNASTRYRYHAIPVAISVLHRDHPHDYTACRGLAMRFQNGAETLDNQIRFVLHSH